MNSAEKLIEVKVKHEILVDFLKSMIKAKEDKTLTDLDKDEVKDLLKVMGYYKEPEVEVLKPWDNSEPIVAVLDNAIENDEDF